MFKKRTLILRKKILIIDEMHPSIVQLLENQNFQVDYLPNILEKEVFEIINQYTGLIIRSKIFVGKEILEKATNLKFIARAGAGMDQIVEEEVRQRNITLINAPEGNRDAVAEHAIGMILALFNKILISDKEIRNGTWLREQNRGIELGGKTIGIIGYGNNGKAFAKKIRPFDCQVITYDISNRAVWDRNATPVDMETIFKCSDVVSFHIPLTPKTNNLVNANFINQFTNNIWLINTSRGNVIVLEDVLDAMKDGKILGACLDVLPEENLAKFQKKSPEVYKELMNNPKIILTPHVAGWSQESYIKINNVLSEKIAELNIGN